MKTLILISLLLISTNHFSQDKVIINTELVTDRENHWMMNITTNPQMRLNMMQMMIEYTIDKPNEMLLLVNQILKNSEMNKMISKASSRNVNEGRIYINMPEMMNKNNTIMKKTGKQKKPKIDN
ncbi:MAG: hypothetical protein U5K00_23360 [Melioribacteraceae bacterium]|nr:hypothetical protein [Melioribacteraceae bacterium]